MSNVIQLQFDKRWKAVCVYRSEAGPIDVEYHIEELEELQGIVERGPNWSTLDHITITLNRTLHEGPQTIDEEARETRA